MTSPAHDELPLPDYDHLPVATLRDRIRSLDAPALEAMRDYERAHGNRLPVLAIFEQRLDALRAGAAPSPGTSGAIPEAAPPPAGGSPVSEATTGPAMNPPSHGDPTNPAQPRATG